MVIGKTRLRVGRRVSSKVVLVFAAMLMIYHSMRASHKWAVVNVPRAIATICHVPMARSPLPERDMRRSIGISIMIKSVSYTHLTLPTIYSV